MKPGNILISLFGMLLSGCAGLTMHTDCDADTEHGVVILHPSAYKANLISNQQVTINTSETSFEFLAQLEISGERLALVALTPIGQKLFQIQYRPQRLSYDRYGIPDSLEPAYLLADIGMIYADKEMLDRCFRQAGFPAPVIEQEESIRRIQFSGQKTIVISYSNKDKWNSDIMFSNPNRNYKIRIQSLAVEQLRTRH